MNGKFEQMQNRIDELVVELNQVKEENAELISSNKEMVERISRLEETIHRMDDQRREQMERTEQINTEIANIKKLIPNPPPFSVHFEIGLNNPAIPIKVFPWGNIVPLNKVISDSNNTFNINEHCFVIPVSGVWMIQGQCQILNQQVQDSFFHIGIDKNGATITGNGFYHKAQGQEFMAITWVGDCIQGDKIYLQVYENTQVNSFLASLKGYLMTPNLE
ncbi:hypothetical protein M9Y10_025036 [Tritrichomonas musculus]|uniref:Uncharacterized protein n=1 Tax=Tritrichomonas musculus TaxID=1915356 RepID=A0ABR2HAD3_9EUKA